MENNNNFKTFFNRIPLNKIIDNYDKNKFLNINKIKIIETEINKVKKLPKNMSNRNKIKTLKKRKLSLQPKHLREKKISNIIGVDEGLISLPKVLSTKIWKKNNENEMEKKNTEKILKNNFGSITNYLSEDDKDNKELFKEKKIEENEIKKLNNWDLLHIKDMKNVKHSQSFKFIAKNLEMPEIKWMLDIKNDPKSINILSRNKKLKEFFKGLEEEQNAIFNMNMNINKKNYLLDVYNDDNNEEDVEINREDKKSSVDYYKDVMRDKIKVEEFLRNDLADLSQQIYDKKNMKKKLAININKIINKINNIEFEKKNYYENQNEKIKFFEGNQNFYFDINNNNNKKKKNKNNSSKNLINEKYKNNFNEKISNKEKKIYNKREIQKLKTKLNNFLTSLNTKKIELNEELKSLQNNVKIIEEEIKKIKVRISSRIIEQRKYFFDILKKGIDVRKEGLSWVIIKLIELNGFFEESKFPKFLNNSQIDYLLKISYKQYELNELLKLFYVLKDKQNCLKNEYEKHHKKEVNSNDLNENKKDNFNEENNENYSIPIKYYKKFENIAQKYEKVTNIRINEQKEEKYLKKIVCDLQEKIKKKYYYSKEKINFDNENNENDENDENDKLLFLPGSLAEFFSKNKKFRDYFDDIFYLNSEIRKRQKEIKNLRKEEIEKFKKNNKGKISNLNMIFLALFGNGINI